MYRFLNKALLLIAVTLASQMPAVSVADTVSEYTIKAAFIYNFARFTEWSGNSDEIKVCVYGKDPFGSSIDSLDGKIVKDKPIKIVRTQLIEDVKSCHIVFLNVIPPERRLFERALKIINGANVLTISDAANVVDFGVMIGMTIDNDKVAFEVNHTAAKAADLEISAKLLRLAKKTL